jgi:hypothetical protein
MNAVQETAWYVYAVLPDGVAPPACGVAVLPGAGLELIGAAGLTALVSLVPRALFVADDPAGRAGEPDWVAARAAAHHEVVALAAAGGPCLPLGFGTLFSSSSGVTDWLDAHAAALLRALALVAGREEWAVTIIEDAAAHMAWLRAHDADLLARAAAAEKASRGTAFLLARQLDKALAAARDTHEAAVATTLQAQFTALGAARAERAAGAARLAWSVLAAPEVAVAAAMADIEVALQGTGLGLRLTGPWPPYAFARAAWQESLDA